MLHLELLGNTRVLLGNTKVLLIKSFANFLPPGEEECDAGSVGEDSCCTAECMFSAGAVCSARNSECCSECQYAGANTTCYESSATAHDKLK